MIWVVPVAGLVAVLMAAYLTYDVLRRDKGTEAMQDVAAMIYEGAIAFMKRQYLTIAILAIVGAVILSLVLWQLSFTDIDGDGSVDASDKIGIAWRTGVAFLVGAFCSALAGIVGMLISVKANLRTAAGALHGGVKEAIVVGLRGGAVSGFLIVALSLLGVTGIFYAYDGANNPGLAPFLIVGFGFGASFVALFSQLGGGIYTKAADMGADLVGKVEAGIPEDDPRNAAVIADLVGDNVGDCAGRGADIFESTAAENIGAMILGVALYFAAAAANIPHPEYWVLFPLVIRAFGVFATAIGVLSVQGSNTEDPMVSLNKGYFISVALSVVFLAICTKVMLGPDAGVLGNGWVWFFFAGLVGVVTSVAFVFITQYYTENKYRPVQEIADSAKTGPATVAVTGMSVGLESTFATAVTVSAALLLANWLGNHVTLPTIAGTPAISGGLFGTAVATMGMLMTAAYILAMDTFGPITDNAAGIIEMSDAPESARRVTDKLDAVGNTTKALTKGYAVGSAALAAFLLFSAYLSDVEHVAKAKGIVFEKAIDLAKPEVFVGGLLGAMLVFLFSAMAIRAVSKTATAVIEEVRRQFREDPGIMTRTSRPDYARCVDITAKAGLREMVLPGLLAIGLPILVGVVLKAEAVGAFLMVGTIAGLLMATVLNNSGGAWDNAKKYVESGAMKVDGVVVKKGSPIHAAAVVGDTIGDPYKDTAGPSLHVLVKLLATITLVLAPIFI